jgi:restriction system protein
MHWPTADTDVPTKFKSIYRPAWSSGVPLVTQDDIDEILKNTRDDTISEFLARPQPWTAKEPHLSGPIPSPPKIPDYALIPEIGAQPTYADFAPEPPKGVLGRLANGFTGAYGKRKAAAQEKYNKALAAWRMYAEPRDALVAKNSTWRERYTSALAEYEEMTSRIQSRMDALKVEHKRAETAFYEEQSAEFNVLRNMASAAINGDPLAVQELVRIIHLRSPYPIKFPRQIESVFDPSTGILMVEVEVPGFDFISIEDVLKTKTKPVSDRARRRCQEHVILAVPLRLIHEVFAAQSLNAVAMVSVNAVMDYIDKKDGQQKRGIVSSIAVRREAFIGVNVRAVDPKTCFRSLKGIVVPSVEEIVPVPPIMFFNKDDKRIVQSQEVLNTLDAATNLAAMDWEDFEHLVRELFEKEFLSRSPNAEVKVTRASRDWGVDAIIFDPDPLHGGKIVIQAKRYTNLVDVAAVRDLYGTVVNEGAVRGILVTTSSFGPESREFVRSKPLVLIDGANLLSLLEKHGYRFSIDINAARLHRQTT